MITFCKKEKVSWLIGLIYWW